MNYNITNRESWELGYQAGFKTSIEMSGPKSKMSEVQMPTFKKQTLRKQNRKFTNSPKQKLLSEMTNKKWNVYKKGSGKKTWIQIRGEVSRSQAYKKKAKRL